MTTYLRSIEFQRFPDASVSDASVFASDARIAFLSQNFWQMPENFFLASTIVLAKSQNRLLTRSAVELH